MESVTSDDNNSSEINFVNGGASSSTASSPSSQQQNQRDEGGAPPPFLTKTYDMIDDASSDLVVSWSDKGNSFVVWNPPEFARDLLPKFFKHNNFSSFVRQLNTYGFRKVDPDRWEFANEDFIRGQKHRLKGIHRRKPSAQVHSTHHHDSVPTLTGGTGVGTGNNKVGLEADVERLNRDKNVLMLELVRIRQQQQQQEKELHLMSQRLQGTEQRQQHMISFLAKAIQSSGFLAHVLQRGNPALRHEQLTGTKRFRSLTAQEGENGEDCEQHKQRLQDLKMVKYDPRETLARFFNTGDLAAKLETPMELERLVRDLIREQEEAAAEESISQATANTPCSDLSSELEDNSKQYSPHSVVTEASKHSPVTDVPLTPPLNLSLSPGTDLDENKTTTCTGSVNRHDSAQLQGEVQASVDSGAVGVGFNDVFWERFLTDSEATETATRSSD